MSNNRTTYDNQVAIRALLLGKTIQVKTRGDSVWEDYDVSKFVDDFDPFGPWNSADCYEWRIKPEAKEITLKCTFKKTITLEGVKSHQYKAGEQLYFIEKHEDGYKTHKYIPLFDNNEEFHEEVIFFETEEAMNKAFEQIINAQKGLQ